MDRTIVGIQSAGIKECAFCLPAPTVDVCGTVAEVTTGSQRLLLARAEFIIEWGQMLPCEVVNRVQRNCHPGLRLLEQR